MNKEKTYGSLLYHSLRDSPWHVIPKLAMWVGSVTLSVGGWLLGLSTGKAVSVSLLGAIVLTYLVYWHGKAVWTTHSSELMAELEMCRSKRASLEVVFKPEFPMWWAEQRWYRIGVHNSGPASAEDVEARLVEMKPNPLEFNVLPSLLGIKGSKADRCRINRGTREYWDVVSQSEEDGEDLCLWTKEGRGTVFRVTEDSDYQTLLTIQVSASNADPLTSRFLLQKLPGRPLELRRLDRN